MNGEPARPRSHENGGILVELAILAFLLTVFGGGAWRVHRALHQRFEKIVENRNRSIREIRGETAQFLPNDRQLTPRYFGSTRPRAR